MKTCPYCAEQIQDEALKCKHCGSMLDGPGPAEKTSSGSGLAGAFLAIVGLIFGFGGMVLGGNVLVRTICPIIGIILLVRGAKMGAKYK